MASSTWRSLTCTNYYVKDVAVEGFAQVKNGYPASEFAYVVKVTWSDGSVRFIKRLYNDFVNLQAGIAKSHSIDLKRLGGNVLPYLPRAGRSWFRKHNSTSPDLAEKREMLLNKYVQRLIQLPHTISRRPFVLSFFESRKTDPQPFPPIQDEESPKMSDRDGKDHDFFFDMEISQLMLSDSGFLMSPQDDLQNSFLESFWCAENDSFANVLLNAGSEPVLGVSDEEVEELLKDSNIFSDSGFQDGDAYDDRMTKSVSMFEYNNPEKPDDGDSGNCTPNSQESPNSSERTLEGDDNPLRLSPKVNFYSLGVALERGSKESSPNSRCVLTRSFSSVPNLCAQSLTQSFLGGVFKRSISISNVCCEV